MSVRYAFAHRGGSAHGPDNELSTFREALRRGATALESDAWLTADGVVVLDHDGKHRPLRGGQHPIAETLRADLPDHVLALADLYESCGTDFDLALDVRHPDVAAAVVTVARQHGAADRLWLVAAAHDLMDGWRSLGADVHLALSIKLVERSRASVRAAAGAGAEALNMRWPWWSRRYVARVHDAGMLAFGYDVQSDRALRRCRSLGLDGIFSDDVGRLRKAIAPTAR